MDLRLRIKSESDVHAKFKKLQKDNEWTGQAAAMHIFKQYFNGSNPVTAPIDEIKITPPKKEKAAVPVEEIINLYHTYCPDLSQTRKAGATLIKQITARYNEDKEHQSGDWWRQYFTDVSKSDFLCGRASDFKASLMWLTKPTNMEKVLGGQYISHQATGVSKAPQQHSQVTTQNISNMTSWLEKKNAEE